MLVLFIFYNEIKQSDINVNSIIDVYKYPVNKSKITQIDSKLLQHIYDRHALEPDSIKTKQTSAIFQIKTIYTNIFFPKNEIINVIKCHVIILFRTAIKTNKISLKQ